MFFFFKQKTAYEMRISDWSSDVCSSDLNTPEPSSSTKSLRLPSLSLTKKFSTTTTLPSSRTIFRFTPSHSNVRTCSGAIFNFPMEGDELCITFRSEEHTSQLQSLMRLSYAVFCLQKNIQTTST